MPETVAGGALPDPDRHFRRAVWIAFIVTMVGGASMFASKAAEDRTAFIRWRHQILDFAGGTNIWDQFYFPNPPIMPISFYPIMSLPPITGALTWFTLKALLASASIWLCFRMVNATGKVLPSWVQGLAILLSLRPILSDQHHGNMNIIILFLIVTALYAWRKGFDVLSGLLMGLAITYKITPALFVPYFLWKRQWRTAGATMLAVGVFLLLVPSLVIGPEFNGRCLASWWHRIMSPYVAGDVMSSQEVNQSMGGVLARLLCDTPRAGAHGYGGTLYDLNIASLPPTYVSQLNKRLSIVFVAILAFACRTRASRRDDPRLLGEFALVVLTMLIVSERSWKHHFVTMLLPYTYLTYRVFLTRSSWAVRGTIAFALALSAVLMGTTSSEIGKSLFGGNGHKIAQFYGMFFFSALVLHVATVWRLLAERDAMPSAAGDATIASAVPSPHFAGLGATSRAEDA